MCLSACPPLPSPPLPLLQQPDLALPRTCTCACTLFAHRRRQVHDTYSGHSLAATVAVADDQISHSCSRNCNCRSIFRDYWYTVDHSHLSSSCPTSHPTDDCTISSTRAAASKRNCSSPSSRRYRVRRQDCKDGPPTRPVSQSTRTLGSSRGRSQQSARHRAIPARRFFSLDHTTESSTPS